MAHPCLHAIQPQFSAHESIVKTRFIPPSPRSASALVGMKRGSGRGRKERSSEEAEELLRIANGGPVRGDVLSTLYQSEERCLGPPACKGVKKFNCL